MVKEDLSGIKFATIEEKMLYRAKNINISENINNRSENIKHTSSGHSNRIPGAIGTYHS